jgi:hypothetical protein
MIQEQINKSMAVSYLLKHSELRPDETKKLFERLEQYDKIASNTHQAYENAEKSMTELGNQLLTIKGSIQAIVGVISDTIDKNLLNELSKKYIEEKKLNNDSIQPEINKNEVLDIAGSTLKSK